MARHLLSGCGFHLNVGNVGIFLAGFEQLLMLALTDDSAVFQNQNQVGRSNGGNSLGHDDFGGIAEIFT